MTDPTMSTTITQVQYNAKSGSVTIDFNYQTTLDPGTIQVQVTPTNDSALAAVPPSNVSAPAKTTNNVALVYY